MEQYTEEEGEMAGNGDSVLEFEEEEEFLKVRKEHVFGEIDFTKRKSKIACTLGYSYTFLIVYLTYRYLDLLHVKWRT